MAFKLKSYELRKKTKADLQNQLSDLKHELATLRVQQVSGNANAKGSQLGVVRKNIARVMTAIRLSDREAAKTLHKDAKFLPLDLRQKKTRAIRRRLTTSEAKRVTEKTKKRQIHFPARKYALMA